jgi:HSP20 family protein
MALLTKRNGNAPAQRARSMPTTIDFFPDILGLSRLLDTMSTSAALPEAPLPAFPPVDISEQDGKYVVEAALPGFGKDEVSIEVGTNQVTISGEHDEKQEDRKQRYSEIRRAAFARTLTLPRDVNPENATATFENGVLKITLEPMSPIGAKKIPIEAK